jgi:serine protease
MRLPLSILAALAAVLLWPFAALPAAAAATADARVIVTFKSDAPLARRIALDASGAREGAAATALAERSAERVSALGRRAGIALRAGSHVSERAQVFFARGGVSARQLVARLAADGEVESVVVDQRRQRLAVVPNDPLYAAGQPAIPGPAVGQWYLRAPAGAVKSAINAERAWALTLGKASVVVAVLDTGVRFDHADLAGKLLPGYDFISDVPTANDGNGRDADASDPGDWISAADISGDPDNFGSCTEDSSSWHGTQTASIVGAATDNGVGMAGVGRNVRVLPVRVLGKCGGYDSDIQAAMRWAAGLSVPGVPDNTNKAAVINLSLGSSGACDGNYPAVIGEVVAAGTAIVAAAGNSAGHAVGTPANCAGVIAVGALRHVGTKVGYSDVGPEIAISAPGGNCVNVDVAEPCLYPIITALNSGTTTPVAGSSIYSDAFGHAAVGTSYSAPMVAGTVALMISARPALLPAELRNLLQSSARPFPTSGGDAGTKVCHAPTGADQDQCYCTTSTCGAGMLDASAAVQAALAPVVVRITITPDAPQAGVRVNLSAAASVLSTGRTIAAVKWTLTDGGGIASGFVDGVDDAVTVGVLPSDAGSFTVAVTVIDDQGASASSTLTVSVADASGGGSSGGGGAMGLVWLALLAAGAIAAARANRGRV